MSAKVSRSTSLVVIASLVVIGLSGCGSPSVPSAKNVKTDTQGVDSESATGSEKMIGTSDGPTYSDVSFLKQSSDVVIMGKIGRILSRERDDPDKSAKITAPMIIHEVEVTEVIKGELKVGGMINLISYDTDQITIEGTSALITDQQLLLFLGNSPQGSPGIESVSSFYYLKGNDQGVFDVRGADVVARSEVVRSINGEEGPFTNDRLSVDLKSIASAPERSR